MSAHKNPNLFVFAAPSGAGKTTLVHEMVKRDPALKFSISYTTRKRRVNEEHGRDYFFVSEDEFTELQRDGELLEAALVFDNHYGTSRKQVSKHLQAGRNVILEIDWQGAQQVRESMPEAVSIFILPPSVTELERRLRDRKTDAEETISRRLSDALGDMSHWKEFGYVIINDDLGSAVNKLMAVIDGKGESSRVGNPALDEAVEQVLNS
jgi:guanylate kinase